MTDIDITEATRLAAEAMRATVYREECPHEGADPYDACLDCGAPAAVTAALPALAEQFAALIRADYEATVASPMGYGEEFLRVYLAANETAARLVREAAEVTE